MTASGRILTVHRDHHAFRNDFAGDHLYFHLPLASFTIGSATSRHNGIGR
jgi:hypothetical protein